MNYSFHHEAEAEFEQAIYFYENCEPGLGETFSEEVYAVVVAFCTFPDRGQNIRTAQGDASAIGSRIR